MLKILNTSIADLYIIEPTVYGDHRGWFVETYSLRELQQLNIFLHCVQDNHSFSAQQGTLRGLHFQAEPKAQAKLVRCTRGAILDVSVDIRRASPTYLQWVSVELTADNHRQMLIPRGFAHGFLTLVAEVEVQYKVDEYYSPAHDRGIAWNDPELHIQWGIEEPILSEKDRHAPLLREITNSFSE